jgi:cytoskeletal protein CcmA (bactofilin family)
MDDKVRCPRCGTTRLHVLKRLDGIDRLHGNRLANEIRARRGDTIYHCIYCRLQFYDARKPNPVQPQKSRQEEAKPESEAPWPDPSESDLLRVELALPVRPEPAPPEPAAAKPVRPDPEPLKPPEPALPGACPGSGVVIRGAIQAGEDIYISGRVEGTVTSQDHRVIVGREADVKANIRAAELEVQGARRGDSQVTRRMLLGATAEVAGDIHAARLAIEDGARVRGSVDPIREPARPAMA